MTIGDREMVRNPPRNPRLPPVRPMRRVIRNGGPGQTQTPPHSPPRNFGAPPPPGPHQWRPVPITNFTVHTTQAVQMAMLFAQLITILRPEIQSNVVGDAFLYGLEQGTRVQYGIGGTVVVAGGRRIKERQTGNSSTSIRRRS